MVYSKDTNTCFLKCQLESDNFSHQKNHTITPVVSHTYSNFLCISFIIKLVVTRMQILGSCKKNDNK